MLTCFHLQPCAVRLLGYKSILKMNDETRWSKVVKCSESMWKLAYYATVQIWVLSIIKQEPWSLDTKEYWPNQQLKWVQKGWASLPFVKASWFYILFYTHVDINDNEIETLCHMLSLSISSFGWKFLYVWWCLRFRLQSFFSSLLSR